VIGGRAQKPIKELLGLAHRWLTRQPRIDMLGCGRTVLDSRPKPLPAHLGGYRGVVAEEDAHSVNLHFRLVWPDNS